MLKADRRSFLTGTLTLAGAAAGGATFGGAVLGGLAPAWAQTGYAKGQTVRIISPFPPGGSVDAISRMMQPGLQQRIGATVVVENRTGAGGAIGAASVAKSAPDGLNILTVFDSHAVLPSLMKLQFDMQKDLDPVMLIGTAPMVVACHPDKPFKTFTDVVAASRAKPDSLTYGTVGNGSLGHLLMAQLAQRGKYVIRHLPYRGGGPAVNDAVAGHIDLIIGSAALLAAQIEGGKLRPLMQSGASRIATLPNTPTIAEAGFAGNEAYAWWGVHVRAGTPKAIIAEINAGIREALSDPAIRKKLETSQQIKLELSSPEDYGKFFAREAQIWGEVVKQNNISLN